MRFSGGTLVPMAPGMLRRLASRLAVSAAAAAAASALAAVPAGAGTSTVFTLTGHGWGHGIGLSQYGALGYAQHGWAYDAIVKHYFQGARLRRLGSGIQERVQLASGRRTISFGDASRLRVVDEGGTTKRRLPAGSYRIQPGPTGSHLRVIDLGTGRAVVKRLAGPVRLKPGSRPLRVDSTVGIGWAHDHWHGFLRVIRTGSSLELVNLAPLEYYLRGVVPSEMPASWLRPALRAQAVAARSYAVATRHPSSAFDAYADTRSQVYGPIEHEASASTAAVTATAHQVLWYHGAVAIGFFSSSSGGRTASEQAAWGTSSGEPYLVPVRDRYDAAGGLNPNHTWAAAAYTPGSLAAALGGAAYVGSVDLTIDGPSRRVTQAVFHTNSGGRTLTGAQAEVALGLRSNYFRIKQVSLGAHGSLVAGTRVRISGRVWPRPSGRVSLLRHSGPGAPWKVAVRRLALGRNGAFAVRLGPTANRVYRVRTPRGAVSPRRTVLVRPALALERSSGSFRATMYPALRGETLALQHRSASGWRTVDHAPVGRHGHARFARAATSGSWRVSYPGDAHHPAARSAPLDVHVVLGPTHR